MDFNSPLKTFEPNIWSLRHILDLALTSSLSSPPRFLFTSTVGVFSSTSLDSSVIVCSDILNDCYSSNLDVDMSSPAKEVPSEAHQAVYNGYAESKWVAERMLQIVQARTSLRPVTIRVGQLSGEADGTWPATQWFPSLIASSVHLGCLPQGSGVRPFLLDTNPRMLMNFVTCRSYHGFPWMLRLP